MTGSSSSSKAELFRTADIATIVVETAAPSDLILGKGTIIIVYLEFSTSFMRGTPFACYRLFHPISLITCVSLRTSLESEACLSTIIILACIFYQVFLGSGSGLGDATKRPW
jgi:hypothetical protein